VVEVFEPVWVVEVPVDGVELDEEPPAVVLAELPVDDDDDALPVPVELAEVLELVVVDALAEPLDVGDGVGVGAGVGHGVGVGVGAGVGVGVGAGVGVGDGDVVEGEPP
jgi:hypothetical protein